MTGEPVLIDTSYVVALANRNDRFHHAALRALPLVRGAVLAWVAEPVLLEVAAALSASNRAGAVRFIRECYRTPNIRVVTVDSTLLLEATDLYEDRADKTWSLADCVSFLVMRNHGISRAATSDHHFEQAGFTAILLGDRP